MMALIVAGAMLACLGIGYLIGWIAHSDRQEAREHIAVIAGTGHGKATAAIGRHAETWPLRLRPPGPSTDELRAYYAAASSHFPGLAAQPPLAELVRPSGKRATDFIAKLEADTDRWIAANIP